MTKMDRHSPVDRHSPLLIHHMANRDHNHPPNSLAALRHCLEAGARVVEVDINPLRDGGFALLHDDLLEHETNGTGIVGDATADQVRALYRKNDDVITGEPVGTLSEAVRLIQDYDQGPFQELQLDLKIGPTLTTEVLQHLIEMVEPVKELVRVTSGADWAVRRLRELDPDLPLGFDPLLYLEIADTGEGIPPFRLGAYGYWDDHPLSARRWGNTADYLAARADALWAQAPDRAVWYVDAWLLDRSRADGFEWISYLHHRSTEVDAWTLDAGKPKHLTLAHRLVEAGIDRITTNNAPNLATALNQPSLF